MFPPGCFADELFPASLGETVILEFTIVIFCGLPLRADPTLALHAMQSRIERTVLHLQHAVSGALDVLGDLMAMSRSEEECAQNDHIEGTVQEFRAIWRFLRSHDGRDSTLMRVDALPWRK